MELTDKSSSLKQMNISCTSKDYILSSLCELENDFKLRLYPESVPKNC